MPRLNFLNISEYSSWSCQISRWYSQLCRESLCSTRILEIQSSNYRYKALDRGTKYIKTKILICWNSCLSSHPINKSTKLRGWRHQSNRKLCNLSKFQMPLSNCNNRLADGEYKSPLDSAMSLSRQMEEMDLGHWWITENNGFNHLPIYAITK